MTTQNRLVPHRTFPPYAFTGFPQPHPVNDPRGHSWGHEEEPADALEEFSWSDNEEYLYGFDLFNFGYYWEAHEAWEAVWIASGKKGPIAEFLKGLIKMTAAGVKARNGQTVGVQKHSEKAVEHFEKAAEGLNKNQFAGFTFQELQAYARSIHDRADSWLAKDGEDGPKVVFDQALLPQMD